MQAPSDNPGPRRAVRRPSVNGDKAGLAVDRAIGELRRGRAVAITEDRVGFVFAAIETLGSALLQRLADVSPDTCLVLTAERARAANLAPEARRPMSLGLGGSARLDDLRRLAGMSVDAARDAKAAALEPVAEGDSLVLAALGLAKAARLVPALVGFKGERLADESLLEVSLSAILEYAAASTSGVQLISESRVPLAGSEASRVALFRDDYGGSEHVAVIIGEPDLSESVPVRVHSACLTGDLLGSLRCDCGDQLHTAIERIAGLGGGILLYLDQEGRSIGLANKLRAYAIQDTGVDTFDANRHLGFSSDERNYDVAAAMLQQIGVARVRLLTNNPRKIDALREHGIEVVDRLPLVSEPNEHNAEYLRSKRERAGHLSG